MKIAQINMILYGSTGKIMLQIAETARKHGHEVRTYSTIPFDTNTRPRYQLKTILYGEAKKKISFTII